MTIRNRLFQRFLGVGLRVAILTTLLGVEPTKHREAVGASPVGHTGAGQVLRLVEPRGRADLEKMDQRIYVAAEKLARYLRGLVRPWKEDPKVSLLTDSRHDEHHVRPNTGAVEGFCALYRFGPYEESVVGVSRSKLLQETILPMTRYLVSTHVTGSRPTGDGRRWGDAWQSAHWAQMLGHGAWYVWADLPDDLRAGVARVVAHEADRIAGTVPPHQIRLDTKAEENAWNSRVLSVAVLLMPSDSRRPGWEAAFQKWAMSSFLRPADAQSQVMVDGRTVAAQFGGANIYDDFTLENHDIVHPDYMTCFALSLGASLEYSLSGCRPPECLLHNAAGIYENLKWFVLPDGGFVYPNGQDWQLFRNADWIGAHVQMAVFGRDPDAWSLACRSLDTLEKMQARSDTGAVYAPGETFFASTHADLLHSLTTSWLILKTADRIERAPHDRLGVRRLDSGKIILRRTGSAVHTFSWGAKIMAQCVPYRLDRIVSPHQGNGIGHIVVKGRRGALPTRLRDVNVTQGDDWFAAELSLDHGEAVRATLHFRSNPDGSWTMREKLVALCDVTTTEVATGLIGILNNPGWVYERGRRRIKFDSRVEEILALSRRAVSVEQAQEIEIDGVLRIRGSLPLRPHYVGAARPDRARATDELYLNYLGGERSWRTGATVSEYEATVRCSLP
jgi:hypothetical protein